MTKAIRSGFSEYHTTVFKLNSKARINQSPTGQPPRDLGRKQPMFELNQSRHFDSAPRTSTFPRSADIADQVRQVRKVPTPDVTGSYLQLTGEAETPRPF
jgi:hypothetical protein